MKKIHFSQFFILFFIYALVFSFFVGCAPSAFAAETDGNALIVEELPENLGQLLPLEEDVEADPAELTENQQIILLLAAINAKLDALTAAPPEDGVTEDSDTDILILESLSAIETALTTEPAEAAPADQPPAEPEEPEIVPDQPEELPEPETDGNAVSADNDTDTISQQDFYKFVIVMLGLAFCWVLFKASYGFFASFF